MKQFLVCFLSVIITVVLLCGCAAGTPTSAGIDAGTPSSSVNTTASATQSPSPDAGTITPSPEITVSPTFSPTPEAPSATPSPSVSHAPAPTPTASFELPEPAAPDTDCGMTFTEAPYGMPSEVLPVCDGVNFNLRGTVSSEYPLTRITLTVIDSDGKKYTGSVTFSAGDGVLSYALNDNALPAEKKSLDSLNLTKSLACGICLMEITASSTQHSEPALLFSRRFEKLENGVYILSPNNFRDGFYQTALDFFGSEEEFLFSYTLATGRHINQETAWKRQHITTVMGPDGKKRSVNVKAAEQFSQAYQYMQTTFIRVRGSSFDTGVIPLSSLAAEFNGTYVSRFVTGNRFISHHAFGTAEDVNASQPSNRNSAANTQIITDEVALLDYEGMVTQEGGFYFSFVYNGSCTEMCGGVPQTVVNYLIYELSYFRAGFGWGYYYTHTCDAMHFTLSEVPAAMHNAENGGLRKVYSYQPDSSAD